MARECAAVGNGIALSPANGIGFPSPLLSVSICVHLWLKDHSGLAAMHLASARTEKAVQTTELPSCQRSDLLTQDPSSFWMETSLAPSSFAQSCSLHLATCRAP